MKKIFRVVLLTLMIVPAALSAVKGQEEATIGGKKVVRIVIDGAISPVVADYIDRSLKLAVEEDAALLILQLDTPGGLISSTRQIVKTLLGAEVPVAVHVAPPGARAASAGVFITMAGHIAAMAPGTNIGAAHPVSIGGGSPFGPGKKEEGEEKKGEGGEGAAEKGKGTDGKKPEGEGEKPALDDESVMAQKVINDTVAFARSIAERHGRNADWAERAVRESVSVTEKEALELNVIDVVAETTEELIKAIDGRKVTVSGKEVVLALKDSPVEDHHMGWRHKVLSALSDPNIAYILMMLGIYGLFFELANPGVILPGVLGGIFLILAFFSFQVIPINYAGFLLIIVGVILFILEVKVVSYGMLTVGGIIALALGSIMLFETAEPYYRLSGGLVAGVTVFTALFFVVVLGLAIRAQRRKPTTGVEGLIGQEGVVTVPLDPEGTVRVRGEIWSASARTPLPEGAKVRVTSVSGMRLTVEGIEGSGGDRDEEGSPA